MRVAARKTKKMPGFETPCFRAYRGKKAAILPQIKLSMKAMRAGGTAPRLRKDWVFWDFGSEARDSLFPNFNVRKKEHNDRPVQTRKRIEKLKLLMRIMPRYGPRAKAMLKDKK
jgi:hypothetical protein